MSFDSSSSSWYNQNRNLRNRTSTSSRSRSRDRSRYSGMSESDSQFQNDDIMRLQEKIQGMSMRRSNPISQKIRVSRENLPAFQHRQEIIEKIRQNQVVIISGDTGCGKSTQVTQYIFEDARANGEHVKIACTQPRRIAATSLAERVSEEVGCSLGTAVGYQIGMEKQADSNTNIIYLTPGVLLQQLMRREGRRMYTHIIIDEAHERDLDTEFCLMLLRKFLSKTTVRLVIMSAMMDVEKIQNHFMLIPETGYQMQLQYLLCDFKEQKEFERIDITRLSKPPLLHIGGKRFPVEEFYIEDVLKLVKKTFEEIYPFQQKENIFSTLYPELDSRTLGLGVDLIQYIIRNETAPICILVFLPGMAEIEEMKSRLECCSYRGDIPCNFIKLHSTVSMTEQRSIFIESTAHKIILSSNIAESSITVPGVKVVINFGMEKSMQFDTAMNIEALKLTWISSASETQRVGRAGRLSSGKCYHMYPRTFARELGRYSEPEIQRSPLEKIMLMILEMKEGRELLDYGIQPPSDSNIERSIDNLIIGGFVVKENRIDNAITIAPLGRFAVKLPLDYRVAKLVFFGLYFGVFTETARIAALFGMNQTLRRETSEMLQKKMAIDKLYSDIITSLLIDDSNRREVTNIVNEITRRIFIDVRDKKLYDRYDVKSKEGEYAIHLALYAAFYPNYFTTECLDGKLLEAVNRGCSSHERVGEVEMNPWYTVAFKGVPDSVTNQQFLEQLGTYFFKVFGNVSVIKYIKKTDRFRLVEFYEFRDEIKKEIYPWGTRMRYLYIALEWLSQCSFYCKEKVKGLNGIEEDVTVRCYAYHPYSVSLVNYFTRQIARIEGGSCLAPLLMKQELRVGGGHEEYYPVDPNYCIVTGLIGESNSGMTMCRKLSLFPNKIGKQHLPILAMIFSPTPVLPFYNKNYTKLRSILFAHSRRSVKVEVYLDETTLIAINRIRNDIKNFADSFEIQRGEYLRPCEVMQVFKELLEKTYYPMKGREIQPDEDEIKFVERNQTLTYLYADHPFHKMKPLSVEKDLELSEDDEAQDASTKIDEYLYKEQLAKGWYPEKRLVCGLCQSVICYLKNVKPPSSNLPKNVIGVMTCTFGLLKTQNDPRIGCCMKGHPCCKRIDGQYVLTEDSKCILIDDQGISKPWIPQTYENFFANIGGIYTQVPPVTPGESLTDYDCPLCETKCRTKDEFLKHIPTTTHRMAETYYRNIYMRNK
ncbi:hypothetical protein ENUP19_0113G0024 [Entamoeba nuttalli]|uniref:Helicase, putative n=2 Tax=Entamoeba nuttalli TaxID=412467 RepID=K2H6P9_ENTNP|nr:helicase, putative [Entamoeba nuttalli P19]EKE42207.1 helicase, putative [Entamoeba nuttalli P19]|eukprot:XP_008855457.1 helicase, putative [Entamoeba nuttalli P19]